MTQPNNSTNAGLQNQILPEDVSWDTPGAVFDSVPSWDGGGTYDSGLNYDLPAPAFDVNPEPPYDAALDAVFQPLISGITGILGSLVLPRWQPVMANKPPVTVNWCAYGVNGNDASGNGYVEHQSVTWDERGQTFDSGLSYDQTNPILMQRDVLQMQEEFEVACSFYGPLCRRAAAMLRDGLQISQNRETLITNGIAYVSAGTIRPLPELINNLWQFRADVILYFRRAVVRTYPVFDLLSAQGTVLSDVPPVSRTFTDSSS